MKFLRSLFVCVLMLQVTLLRAEEITVAVAANFTTAMEQIKSAFEAESEHNLTVSYGSSGRLYAQILNGAPYQLFFSADQEKPQALVEAGSAEAGSLFTYAIGTLALWSAEEGIDMEKTLNAPSGRLALANPRLAPYGVAAMQTLESMGVKEAWEGRLVMGENVSQAFQFVNTGNAFAGFVALSQVSNNGTINRGSGWIVPREYYEPIKQDVVLLKGARDSVAAYEFLEFIRGDQGKAIIYSYGYGTE